MTPTLWDWRHSRSSPFMLAAFLRLGEDNPTDQRMSLAKGRAEMRRRRAKCVNLMQYACRVLCRKKTPLLFDAMEFLSRPLEERFGKEEVMVKTKRGTHNLMLDLSCNCFKDTLSATLSNMASAELCQILQINHGSKLPRDTQQLLANTMWKFVVNLVGALVVSNYRYLIPPRSFIVLTSESESDRQRCLAELAATFRAVEKLEQRADGDRDIAQWLKNMEWPGQVWVRENFSFLAETNFQTVYPWLEEELVGYGRSHNTSLLIENLFNVSRAISKKNPRHRLEPKGMWHAVALGDSCATDFDRECAPVTAVARSAAVKLPKNMFAHEKGSSSIGDEQLEDLC